MSETKKRKCTCSICGKEGHNKNNTTFHPKDDVPKTKEDNKKTGGNGGKALNNENNMINELNNNNPYMRECLTNLGVDMNDPNNKVENWIPKKCNKKDGGFDLKHTEQWKEYKYGTGEIYPTPKTDIVLCNIITKQNINISIKSSSGRPSSGDFYECKAQLLSVLNNNEKYKNDTKLENLVNELIENIIKDKLKNSKLNKTEIEKEYKKDKDNPDFTREFEWYTNAINQCKKCNEIWKEIITFYPHYKLDVMIECLLGKYKFGNNPGCANYLIELKSSTSTEIKEVINLNQKNEQLTKYCEKLGKGNVFATKSAGNTIWMRFL